MNFSKIFCKPLVIIAIATISLLFTNEIKAQESFKNTVLKQSEFTGSERLIKSNVRLNDINPQAFRHFRKNHASVENEYWEKTSKGLIAHFREEDRMSLAYYDNLGTFLYSIKYFEESDLNADLQNRLKREFPGFQFDILTEINNEIKTVYLVTLKNKYAMKSLMIDHGEIRVIDDLNYAGL
jgi:hypothetical protein